MARVVVTGSTTGLGLAAAQTLIDDGHEVVLHARNNERARELNELAARSAGIVTGDLSIHADTRSIAQQVNALGDFDAVIHNAGVYADPERNPTPDGLPRVFAVNVVAPYLLTALIKGPSRLIYLSSGMHTDGNPTLDDYDWTRRRWNGVQAYSDSKLYITALSNAIARLWPHVRSNAVDPGWVPTRMGGPSATDDLTLGHQTQVWLATSDDPAANLTGKYWHHRHTQTPAGATGDLAFQNELLDELARITGQTLD